jgi:hypothetical protein
MVGKGVRPSPNHSGLRGSGPREEKARPGTTARSSSGRAHGMRSRPTVASQDRAGATSASHLLRLSWRGRRHEQHIGAQTPSLCDPAKSNKRLPRHVGRSSRSGCTNNHRHRTAQGRKSLQCDRRHSGLNAALIAKSHPIKRGWVNTSADPRRCNCRSLYWSLYISICTGRRHVRSAEQISGRENFQGWQEAWVF